MPQLTILHKGTFQVSDGKRLVLAIEDSGVDIQHRCGGHARCTTCRVVFSAGEPDSMTQAEHDKLTANNRIGQFRLSCQIVCDHDMTVDPLLTVSGEGLDNAGNRPEEHITPEPVWVNQS